MELKEYIEQARKEINEMEKSYLEEHENDPEMYPLDRGEGEWNEEELAHRFG